MYNYFTQSCEGKTPLVPSKGTRLLSRPGIALSGNAQREWPNNGTASARAAFSWSLDVQGGEENSRLRVFERKDRFPIDSVMLHQVQLCRQRQLVSFQDLP